MESKMVGKKGQKKAKGPKKIEKALLPSHALAAVPMSSTMPESAPPLQRQMTSPPRLYGQPGVQADEFSDPESSLFDYQQMDEAGYSTVGFGTWPNQARRVRDEQSRTPQFRQSAYSAVYAEPGDVERIAERDSTRMGGNISDLYATPIKKKGRGKSSTRTTSDSHGEDEGNTLSGTRQDVHAEMRKVHDMPAADETMVRSTHQDVHVSVNYPDSSHQPDSGRGSTRPGGRTSARSRTPRSGRILESDFEMHQLKVQNEDLQGELLSLRKVADAIRDGDVEGAQNLYVRREMDKLKDENETLKTTVHRLNVELSDYQAKYRPVDPSQLKQAKEISGLPSKGPIPSWLISKRYLAPLFLAYDDHLEEKNKAIEDFKEELAAIKIRAEDILKENQRLRMSTVGLGGDGNERQQLQEQARLVLEENQVLMEQLEVQTHKSKDMYSVHIAEISRMAKKLALAEGEKADMERELQEVRMKYRELKHSHDQVMMETGAQVNVHTHINSISDLKRSLTEEKEKFDKDMETLAIKLKASEQERKNQGLELIELTAENKKLRAEGKAMQRSVKHAQHQLTLLHRAVELSEDKEMVTQEQLAQVIKVAEKTALERDTVYKVAREQQQENQFTVNKMVDGGVIVGKMEEKLKLYRMKAQAKLSTVCERLKDQDETFNSQKKEYERELQYLRLLLKEKEEIINSLERDKKDIETDLDTMWQAANSENHRVKTLLRTGSRKLKEHSNIADALNEEFQYEEEAHFLESEDE